MSGSSPLGGRQQREHIKSAPTPDSPHITQEGFIIHGSNPEARAKVYRLLLHREIISNPREAAREVLVHLQWTREEDTPLQVFPFRALQHLEHWPTP